MIKIAKKLGVCGLLSLAVVAGGGCSVEEAEAPTEEDRLFEVGEAIDVWLATDDLVPLELDPVLEEHGHFAAYVPVGEDGDDLVLSVTLIDEDSFIDPASDDTVLAYIRPSEVYGAWGFRSPYDDGAGEIWREDLGQHLVALDSRSLCGETLAETPTMQLYDVDGEAVEARIGWGHNPPFTPRASVAHAACAATGGGCNGLTSCSWSETESWTFGIFGTSKTFNFAGACTTVTCFFGLTTCCMCDSNLNPVA